MTYSYDIVISSINLYNTLKNNNINGKKRIEIMCESFYFSISAFYKWFYLYKNLSKRDFDNHFKNHTKKLKINKYIIDFILKTVEINTFIRLKGIKDKIKNEYKFNISITSIRIILLKNNISFKKVYKQINPYTENVLKEKKNDLKKKFIRYGVNNIISTDEFGIHLNE